MTNPDPVSIPHTRRVARLMTRGARDITNLDPGPDPQSQSNFRGPLCSLILMASLRQWFSQDSFDWVHRNYLIDWFVFYFHAIGT